MTRKAAKAKAKGGDGKKKKDQGRKKMPEGGRARHAAVATLGRPSWGTTGDDGVGSAAGGRGHG